MPGLPLILADANRADQFLVLGRSRKPFGNYSLHTDESGIAWATRKVGEHVFAMTWLGAGWVFDRLAQRRRAERIQERRAEIAAASAERHHQELDNLVAKLRLGPIGERLLWLIHQQVLRSLSSLLHLPDFLLADAIWGGQTRPVHWRQEIFAVLQGLTWLHLTQAALDEPPALGAETVVLTHAADLRGTETDVCRKECGDRPDCRHHHYLVNVGRGFLGLLEEFVQEEDENAVRSYAFPVGGRGRESASLRKVGKSGNLVTIYLPAKLGDRRVCEELSLTQHRLLQAIVRETTRSTKEDRRSASEAEVMRGNSIPTIDGKRSFTCGLLDAEGNYVGFNGNKVIKGRGYLILSHGGWMAKAGYALKEVSAFLADLSVLSAKLALIPVGIEPRNPLCLNLEQMSALAGSATGMTVLRRLHLRIYSPADYLARWNQVFRWEDEMTEQTVATDPSLAVISAIERKIVSQKQLAEGMRVDPSLLNKVLRGKKRWPQGWLDRAANWLSVHIAIKDQLGTEGQDDSQAETGRGMGRTQDQTSST